MKEDLYLVFEDILTDNTNFRVTNKIEFHTIPQVKLVDFWSIYHIIPQVKLVNYVLCLIGRSTTQYHR